MKMSYKQTTLLASAARTTSGNTESTPVSVGWYKEADLFLNVSAASGGSPTLDVVIETQDPASGVWATLTSFTQKTTTGSELKTISTNLGYRIAVKYTIGGSTPSFTFSVGVVLKE
jgi:hypothetical protein